MPKPLCLCLNDFAFMPCHLHAFMPKPLCLCLYALSLEFAFWLELWDWGWHRFLVEINIRIILGHPTRVCLQLDFAFMPLPLCLCLYAFAFAFAFMNLPLCLCLYALEFAFWLELSDWGWHRFLVEINIRFILGHPTRVCLQLDLSLEFAFAITPLPLGH